MGDQSDGEVDRPDYAFDCPNCGETTGLHCDDPEDLVNKIYECGGCGENVLMNNYVGGAE